MSLTRFGVSMEEELVELLDGLVRTEGYANRSEAIRSMIRKEIVRSVPEDDDREVAGIVTLIYRYGKRLNDVPTTEFRSLRIMANLQLHLHRDVCQKVIVALGRGADVTGWARAVVSQKGVIGELTVVATEQIFDTLDPDHHDPAERIHHVQDTDHETSLLLSCRNRELYRSTGKWLHPLLDLELFLKASGTDPAGCVLYDKVIGKASALLIQRLGITTVRTDLLSLRAEEVFRAAGISCSATETTERLLCRTEDLLLDTNDPEEAYRLVIGLIEQNRAAAATGRP